MKTDSVSEYYLAGSRAAQSAAAYHKKESCTVLALQAQGASTKTEPCCITFKFQLELLVKEN